MQPEPFQSFDAGWVLLGLAVLFLLVWLAIDVRFDDEPVRDDADWDVEPRKPDPEDDARRNPF